MSRWPIQCHGLIPSFFLLKLSYKPSFITQIWVFVWSARATVANILNDLVIRITFNLSNQASNKSHSHIDNVTNWLATRLKQSKIEPEAWSHFGCGWRNRDDEIDIEGETWTEEKRARVPEEAWSVRYSWWLWYSGQRWLGWLGCVYRWEQLPSVSSSWLKSSARVISLLFNGGRADWVIFWTPPILGNNPSE